MNFPVSFGSCGIISPSLQLALRYVVACLLHCRRLTKMLLAEYCGTCNARDTRTGLLVTRKAT